MKVPKTVIFCLLCTVLLGGFHEICFNETVHSAQRNTFDATISSNQEAYYIYEEIIATFNFSSHITNEDYFAFAISENISFNPIFQSEPIQGNFSISKIYTFSLLSLSYSFSGNEKIIYLLLYYFDDLYGNNICCSKAITIYKANLECEIPENFTQIEEGIKYNVTFRLFDSNNPQFALQEEEVICRILFDDKMYDSFMLQTSHQGYIHIQVESIKKSKNCIILLSCNSSKCFNSAQFSIQLEILQINSSSNKIIATFAIIFSICIVCSCFVYLGLLFYKKKLKRNYTIRNIKI